MLFSVLGARAIAVVGGVPGQAAGGHGDEPVRLRVRVHLAAVVLQVAVVVPSIRHAAHLRQAIGDVVRVRRCHCAGDGLRLGSAVAEVLSEKSPTRIVRIGVQDKFGVSGSAPELLEYLGLKPGNIVKAARQIMEHRSQKTAKVV